MYQKTVLNDGLRVVTSTMPYTMSVCVCIFIGTGSRYESEENAGTSHFIEHMCFKGTPSRPDSKTISETIDGIGGVLNGGTDKELTVYWAKVARPHFKIALDLLVDMLRNSKYDPTEIENERGIIIEEINMSMDSPQSRADVLIDELLWPNQALGRDVLGTRETVSSISRAMILDYVDNNYLSKNTVVSVAGDITHDEVVQAVADIFHGWNKRKFATCVPSDNNQDAPRFAIEDKKTEQINLCLAVRGLSHLHQDRFILELLNVILGEGMSSRLFLEIRERRGLAYDIQSHVSYFHDAGSVSVYAGVDPSNIESTLSAILNEMIKLRDEPVPKNEVIKAKELGKGRLMLRMEDTRNVSSWIGGQELLTNSIRTVDDVIGIIDTITAKDLQRVARGLFITSRINLALVGPITKKERLERILKL